MIHRSALLLVRVPRITLATPRGNPRTPLLQPLAIPHEQRPLAGIAQLPDHVRRTMLVPLVQLHRTPALLPRIPRHDDDSSRSRSPTFRHHPVPHGRHHPGQDRRRKRRGPIGDVLPAAGGGQGQRHARQRRRVRAPRASARRAGHGHVLRRPLQFVAAGQQREPQRHDPVPAQTRRHRPRHGARGPGDRRRDQQPPHARARIPHTRRGVHRRTAKLKDPTRLLHLQIDNGDSI